MKIVALILAGGSGTRIKGTKMPKQFLPVAGKPMCIHCLELYDKIKEVNEIVFSVNRQFKQKAESVLKRYTLKKLKSVIAGGKVRQETIRNAFEQVKDADLVIIQNAVSPAVSAKLIKDCIKAAKKNSVVTAFLPAFHCVFEKNHKRIKRVLRRDSVGYACDPQVFQMKAFKKILNSIQRNQSNDVPMLRAASDTGYSTYLVESESENIKTTFSHDLKSLEYVMNKDK